MASGMKAVETIHTFDRQIFAASSSIVAARMHWAKAERKEHRLIAANHSKHPSRNC
jgi:hypothetical protein